MPFVKVATVADVPENSVIEVSVGGDSYAICNVRGNITALSGTCLHQGGPLGQGIIADGRVVCPWHAWEFDCATGANCEEPSERVPVYHVKVEGGEIFIQVP
ncbi:MAG: Rieske (2Fe-2S) protein [Acidobacteriia bacterium]|nr:Rieske (2Fe-2S) protein [Terriglobia bacterium]MBV8905060.1 Rieske (2Fe-2S) protein [Terriglobia bacterium]MBV9744319.1 Rieske (2Fe-2S) protein [Terriglobia bacterium]